MTVHSPAVRVGGDTRDIVPIVLMVVAMSLSATTAQAQESHQEREPDDREHHAAG